MNITLKPIAFVEAERATPEDDYWGASRARIVLEPALPAEALDGLADFSHVEIVYHFHRVPDEKIVLGARHPRGNPDWPAVGILAQRAKNRPNRIGTTTCRLVGIEGRVVHVAELDAIHGTPVLDIKPVMREFLPREEIRQPEWSNELMRDYWTSPRP
ncbi:MAG: hypothetical protein RLZZ303_1397 [Candidatus Hydrogenedentota bacterium]|jgi:tRNA-Thr(GGU) m(6)t(6)A37 methyltransferase TsaA